MGDLTIIEVTTSTFAPTAAPTVAAAAAEEARRRQGRQRGGGRRPARAAPSSRSSPWPSGTSVAPRRREAADRGAAQGPHAGRRRRPRGPGPPSGRNVRGPRQAVCNRLSRLAISRTPSRRGVCGSDLMRRCPVDSDGIRQVSTRRRAFPYPPSPRNQDLLLSGRLLALLRAGRLATRPPRGLRGRSVTERPPRPLFLCGPSASRRSCLGSRRPRPAGGGPLPASGHVVHLAPPPRPRRGRTLANRSGTVARRMHAAGSRERPASADDAHGRVAAKPSSESERESSRSRRASRPCARRRRSRSRPRPRSAPRASA